MTDASDWWDFDPEFYRAVHDSKRDRDSARQRGDANAAPVPQDQQARAEDIARKDQA